MTVIRISEADAARDFGALLERVRKGTEIIIESDSHDVAIVSPAAKRGPGRLLSESIVAAEAARLHSYPG